MPYDPVRDLAELLDGVRKVLDGPHEHAKDIYGQLGELALGPYAALRGGLLLDEPGREHVSTADAIREALAEVLTAASPGLRLARAGKHDSTPLAGGTGGE
jgi:hypothetical protein